MTSQRSAASIQGDSLSSTTRAATGRGIQERMDAVDWDQVHTALDGQGWAIVSGILTESEAAAIAALYQQEQGFRSRVILDRHGFGRGEYKYFSYPLPPLIQALRTSAYPYMVPIAHQWQQRLGKEACFPHDHVTYLERCHQAGQVRPTPLLLKYEAEDYNCLHRDLYGEHVFPLQIAILLNQPGEDFTGGEFVMTEQRPRMQTRAMVLPLKQGDAAIFAVNARPVKGRRGDYRVKLNHGVSRVHSGRRHTLGVIFHDAA